MPANNINESLSNFIQKEGALYTESLLNFFTANGLDNFIGQDFDHIAIKARDTSQYELLVQMYQQMAEKIVYVEMNNRRIATVILVKPILFAPFGTTGYIELMEPRPEKAGKDFVGFEHAEIYVEDLTYIRTLIEGRGIEHEEYTNDFHSAIVCKINGAGQEIKFTDTPHTKIIEEEEVAGRLQVI